MEGDNGRRQFSGFADRDAGQAETGGDERAEEESGLRDR